jgi:hypothetical protein
VELALYRGLILCADTTTFAEKREQVWKGR